jgi:hypothetical protein
MRLQCQGHFKQVEEAVFIQVTAHVNTFRDAIRFNNGIEILLQNLDEGQRIHVLDLSTEEKTAAPPERAQNMMEYSFQFHVSSHR